MTISCGIGNELKIETISAKYGEYSKEKCPKINQFQDNLKCEIKDVTHYVSQRSVFFLVPVVKGEQKCLF